MIILGGTLFLYSQNDEIYRSQLDRYSSRLKSATTEEKRFYALGPAAKAYFNNGNIEEARKLAVELQGLLEKYRDNFNYGNAVQDANIVLGRIAVLEGRIGDAKERLIEAGKSPGSAQMSSFGPNMSLAKDLLEKGERDVVLQYFELCRKFWKSHPEMLDEWAQQVKSGEIPNFKDNLVY